MIATTVQPGDVLLVRGGGRLGRWIRFGAALRDQSDTWNHVIIATHADNTGTRWGIEARPGGVGWTTLVDIVNDRSTISNVVQPKTDEQRTAVVDVARGLLGTPYDWAGIIADAMAAINAPRLWALRRSFGTAPPAHVVCSSLASWVYEHVGLAHPPVDDRTSTPADWADWILRQGWEA